jgi:hypothetical protein
MEPRRLTPEQLHAYETMKQQARKDLVNRLASEGKWSRADEHGNKFWEPNALCIEAADEIQRLQYEIHHLCKDVLDRLFQCNQIISGFYNANILKSAAPDEEPF